MDKAMVHSSYVTASNAVARINRNTKLSFDAAQQGAHDAWAAHYERIGQARPAWVDKILDY